MKIGILTFHSQINYGGVLQTYALQCVLQQMGHDVVIIDRRKCKSSHTITNKYKKTSLKNKILLFLSYILKTGFEDLWKRHIQTENFIRKNLRLTPFHFLDWREIDHNCFYGIDCIIVGSDQVWHFWGGKFPEAYLLEDAPAIPAISYAASIGMTNIPSEEKKRFCEKLRRFSKISVREDSARKILQEMDIKATTVADPTLLAPIVVWDKFRAKHNVVQKERRLFCYFMEDSVIEVFPTLLAYAMNTGSIVDIFLQNPYVTEIPRNHQRLKKWLKWQSIAHNKQVVIHNSADPTEFIECISSATDAITDSFHALMFSIIFGVNIRILKPTKENRLAMFSRIKEYEACVVQGNLIADNLPSAVKSLTKDNKLIFDKLMIQKKIDFSKGWLFNALNGIRTVE